jgi:4-oxalmesaconate hydratase
MIIDVHGHYTTAPRQLSAWRQRQIASAGTPFTEELVITDDEIRETIIEGQLKLQNERGTDIALFSPTAGGMAHHYGDEETSKQWTRTVNDLIYRVTQLFPDNFIGVGQLPESPGVSPANCIDEMKRCVNEYGFVGFNLNPDPTDGYWTGPPMTDKFWFPLYEALEELEVPAMIHVSMSCNPNFHGTGAHYLNGDQTVFMQLIQYDNIFKEFPGLRFVIPHGGGAVPYHWGRYRGICEQLNNDEDLIERLMGNIWFDTCVYHHAGVKFLVEVVGAQNVIFASEMIGAVRSRNPRDDNNYYDDTKRYVDAIKDLSEADRQTIFEGNARKVYPRLDRELKKRGK